jgi:phosphoglycolate phosphatase
MLLDPSLAPALIFDLDGTLADTAPDLLGATNAVLAARDRTPLDLGHLRHMVGFGAKALIAQAMEASGAPVTEDEMPPLVEIFLDHYRAPIADNSWPKPWRC